VKAAYRQTILFLSGGGIAAAVFLAVFAAVCALVKPGLALYMPSAAAWWDWAVRLCLAAAAAAYGFTWVCVLAGTPSNKRLRQLLFACLRVLFSLVRCISRLLHKESAVSRAYIQILNHVVLRRPLRLLPRQVLLLAPHCLQWDQCPHKITRNVRNCRQCGRCPIGEMTALSDRLGISFAVVPGGTLARQVVAACRPKAVVAVACERDLISGMQDVAPLPAVGLLNKRPNGPCFNTDVDIQALKEILSAMIGEDA
jgi:hypothetical protein